MIKFFTHRILFASTYPVGFGDAICNPNCVKYFTENLDHRVLVHHYINEKTYERNGWFFYNHHPCDNVFIHPAEYEAGRFLVEKFDNMDSGYYNYVLIDHVSDAAFPQIREKFKHATFLTIHDSNVERFGIEKLYPYFKLTNESPDYQRMYAKHDDSKQILAMEKLLDGKEFVAVFPFSTRNLAGLNVKGLRKVVSFAKSKGLVTVVCGECFCPYGMHNSMRRAMDDYYQNFNEDEVIDIMGMGLHKVCRILEKARYVFYGPTGSAMLGIYDMACNPNSYLIHGGDSTIMHDIFKHKHARNPQQVVTPMRVACPHFPCGQCSDDIPKVKQCRDSQEAACLNEELVINV